jgi:hypothetical protein
MELRIGRLTLASVLGRPGGDMVEARRNYVGGNDRFLAAALP